MLGSGSTLLHITFIFKSMIMFQLRLQVQIRISLEFRYSFLTPVIFKWGNWSKTGKMMTRDGDACLSSSSLKTCIAANSNSLTTLNSSGAFPRILWIFQGFTISLRSQWDVRLVPKQSYFLVLFSMYYLSVQQKMQENLCARF